MRRERREFFPDQAGKGSLVSSYEAETGLLWMWAGLSCFLSNCSSSVALPFAWIKGSVAFRRGFPTRLSHEGFPQGLSHLPPWCESILGLKVEAVQGKQVSLEWTETSGGLWEWWHDPEVPLAFPLESASS